MSAPNLAAERWRELWEHAQTQEDRLRCALARIASLAYPAEDGSEAEYMAFIARAALEASSEPRP